MRAFHIVLPIVVLCLAGPAPAQEEQIANARKIAGELAQQLGAKLRAELSHGGPESAIAVCKDIAPQLAGRLSRETGGRVARVSLKTRNPLLGTPDPWEQRALAEMDRRAAAGEKPETLEISEVVEEPAGRYFRYLKAIPVQPLCLTCHGMPEVIPSSVQERLRADYPHDRATGYSLGQIRGAVTIKQPR
jgi:hypothetical protein